jgi:hypothetical protein
LSEYTGNDTYTTLAVDPVLKIINSVSGMFYDLYFMNLSLLANASSWCGFYNRGENIVMLNSAQACLGKV